jgi:hypothetical protein
MAKSDYLAKDDEGKAAQFERFRNTIPTYAATLGLAPAAVTAQAADATYFRHILNHARSMQDAGSQWIGYKTNLLSGADLTITKPVTPGEVTPPPATVAPGILARFRELVRQVKASSPYTDAIGTALGIVGPDSADVDPATLTPEISLRLNGGKVDVLWTKNGQEALEIQVDRGTGTWTFLALDTRPDYTDTEPFPATAAKWKYRAIYFNDAQRTGQWSNVAEIVVGG